MKTKLERINEISKENPKEVFTSIYHLIDNGVRIDIWTHFMRGGIIKLCTQKKG